MKKKFMLNLCFIFTISYKDFKNVSAILKSAHPDHYFDVYKVKLVIMIRVIISLQGSGVLLIFFNITRKIEITLKPLKSDIQTLTLWIPNLSIDIGLQTNQLELKMVWDINENKIVFLFLMGFSRSFLFIFKRISWILSTLMKIDRILYSLKRIDFITKLQFII